MDKVAVHCSAVPWQGQNDGVVVVVVLLISWCMVQH